MVYFMENPSINGYPYFRKPPYGIPKNDDGKYGEIS
jgi:hypothetical protein